MAKDRGDWLAWVGCLPLARTPNPGLQTVWEMHRAQLFRTATLQNSPARHSHTLPELKEQGAFSTRSNSERGSEKKLAWKRCRRGEELSYFNPGVLESRVGHEIMRVLFSDNLSHNSRRSLQTNGLESYQPSRDQAWSTAEWETSGEIPGPVGSGTVR